MVTGLGQAFLVLEIRGFCPSDGLVKHRIIMHDFVSESKLQKIVRQ